ncbi:hypothetical protein A3F06_02615 [candidate division TM6 bacterium RIFCSPHIGHO2_12_FULL_36_22]|nr:MAG: hypothetical protein A3F06_02615 [candidate division TM6 bacterium RIFCSPHIGHO2_12_FULL_36_22]
MYKRLLLSLLVMLNCYPLQKITDKLKKLYIDQGQELSGFGIPAEEITTINQQGGNATYGEILPDSLETILKDLKLSKKDIFYDLGSGAGKTVVQVAMTTPAKAVGIELSPTRVSIARKALEKLKKEPGKRASFVEGDITTANLNDATVIFTCSTCFSDDLMKKLLDKFLELKPGLHVISLRQLPQHKRMKLIKEYSLPMTWSDASPVYLYELQK